MEQLNSIIPEITVFGFDTETPLKSAVLPR